MATLFKMLFKKSFNPAITRPDEGLRRPIEFGGSSHRVAPEGRSSWDLDRLAEASNAERSSKETNREREALMAALIGP